MTAALRILAGPVARAHIQRNGLRPQDIAALAGAAGGPKGLVLLPLDKHIFGYWLPPSDHEVHLIGASIGAWRMAAAAMDDPLAAFDRLAHDYIHQHYEPELGRRMPSPAQVTRAFAKELDAFFDDQVGAVLGHRRYRLHVVTSRGRHLLGREGRWRTPLGYLGAVLSNATGRQRLGHWLERVVFSSQGPVPLDLSDLPHRTVPLDARNFKPALLASCSIPFVLQAVHDIPGAPAGAYWDGGITDYHLHWDYAQLAGSAEPPQTDAARLVLYPHFQATLVPGWLDKPWKRRHQATGGLDNVIVLAPAAHWVARLPRGKLPDRQDFRHHGLNLAARVRDWHRAVQESERLAEEWARWLEQPDPARVEPWPGSPA